MLSHLAMKLYYVRMDTEQLAAEETELAKYYHDGCEDDCGCRDGGGGDDGGEDGGDCGARDEGETEPRGSGWDWDGFFDFLHGAFPRKLSAIKKELIALKSSGMDLASQRFSFNNYPHHLLVAGQHHDHGQPSWSPSKRGWGS